jgi:adenylate cyclase
MASESDASDLTGQPSDRRKLIVVVHADVVGYSRLIGRDDTGTLNRMRRLRREVIDPAIAAFGGRIVNTGGDALLMVFDSVDGAVRSALRVQEQVPVVEGGVPSDRAIRFRIGINVGDVIPDGTDVHGDVVNVAARLQAECSPGGICVSRAVRDHMQGRLDRTFEALGSLNLKNIARPVEAFMLSVAPTVGTLQSVERSLVRGADTLPLPDKPSIAVLPFTNLSADPEQEYFSDGVADDIITELSRSRSLFVIARNSSFTYKGKAADIKQVARELGVRYVLEGSVRRSRDRVRVVAQLIDAETGNNIWAERYDRALEDVFAVQDEVTTAVVAAMVPAVTDTEFRRALRIPPERLGAWEAYMRGQWHAGQRTIADHEQAKQFFQRAIAIDAEFSAPYVALARAYLDDAADFGSRSLEEAVELSASWAQKAIALDPDDADARAVVALLTATAGNANESSDQALVARASTPNSPLVMLVEANGLLFGGRPVEARQGFAACLRIDPRGPLSAWAMRQVAISYYYERDYARSVETLRHAIARYPAVANNYRWLAAALGQLGRTEEAGVALQRALEALPRSFEFYTRSRPPWHRPEDHEHMLEGLRKAGWQG